MEVVLGLVAVVAAFAFVLTPIVRARRVEQIEADRWELDRADLEAQRELVYRDLRDLDFDYRVGKLGETDYQELRRHLQRRAAAILMRLDETEADSNDDVEQRILRRRRVQACPRCATTVASPARFCPNCGTPLSETNGRVDEPSPASST